MSDIELVIKIPEDSYKSTCIGSMLPLDVENVVNAIKNGIPLPKGHGTLKDTDAICKDIISALGIRDENYLLEAEEAVYKRIKNAPTIIDADRSEEV